jgi:hypothetical protein
MTLKMRAAVSFSLNLIIATMMVSTPTTVDAQDHTISQSQLGQLSINVAPVESVTTYTGAALSAEVTVLSGGGYTMNAPMSVQRVIYLKPRGESVKAGETVVKLIGSEVEHYYDAYQLKTDLFKQTSELYENNRKLYKQKAISEQQWLIISEQYMTQKLALGEYMHFFDYVSKFDHDEQSLSLKTPIDGVLTYNDFARLNMDQEIVRIIPSQAIRVKLNLPASHAQMPSALALPSCSLNVDYAEGLAHSFYKTLWSEPLKSACALTLGNRVAVNPKYALSAYRVPQTAVFNLHGDYYVMAKQGDGFVSVAISIVSSEENDFIVTANKSLSGEVVASTSVSALQGILMGLGE